MGLKRTDEFRQDAVRIALTSGLTRKQVADDLGVGMSTLNKWITAHRDTDVVSKEDLSLPSAAKGLHPPYRQGQPILFPRLSEDPAPTWLQGVDEWKGQLLRQRRR